MNDKHTVLLVDDDPALLKSVGAILKNNYTVSSVKSGHEALRILETGFTPDIILLDIEMPGLNGFETISLIREQEDMQDIPVMFLTGMKVPDAEVKGISSGAVDYITKPFVKEVLLARMKQHLKKGQRMRQLSMMEKNKMPGGVDRAKYERVTAGLTETEKKLLRLIAKGYSNHEISEELHYSVNYVKKVVSIIYEKNGVGSRSEMKKLLQ